MAKVPATITRGPRAGLLDECIDSLECIQLSRDFGEKRETCQLNLDICRWRLRSFAKATSIESRVGPQISTQSPQYGGNSEDERITLEHLQAQIESAKKKSLLQSKEDIRNASGSFAGDGLDLSPQVRQIHERFTAADRRGSKGLHEKDLYALRDVNTCTRLTRGLCHSIGELEDLVPADKQRRQSARRVVQDFNNLETLQTLYDVDSCGSILHEAVGEQIQEIQKVFQGHNRAEDSGANKNSVVSVGNIYHTSYKIPEGSWTDKTKNYGKNLHAEDSSSVTVGTIFGSGTPGQTGRYPSQGNEKEDESERVQFGRSGMPRT